MRRRRRPLARWARILRRAAGIVRRAPRAGSSPGSTWQSVQTARQGRTSFTSGRRNASPAAEESTELGWGATWSPAAQRARRGGQARRGATSYRTASQACRTKTNFHRRPRLVLLRLRSDSSPTAHSPTTSSTSTRASETPSSSQAHHPTQATRRLSRASDPSISTRRHWTCILTFRTTPKAKAPSAAPKAIRQRASAG